MFNYCLGCKFTFLFASTDNDESGSFAGSSGGLITLFHPYKQASFFSLPLPHHVKHCFYRI
jgi:hypothetical protein